MKTKIPSALIAIAMIALLFGCKREGLSNEPVLQQNGISAKVKTWYEALGVQPGSPPQKSISQSDFRISKPDWTQTKYYPNENIYVTPVQVGAKDITANGSVYKFLLNDVNPAGDITAGKYMYVLVDKKAQDFGAAIQNLSASFFTQQKIPVNFSGAVFEYDLNNNLIFNKHYENGQAVNKTDKLSFKDKDKTHDQPTEPGFANPNECEGEWICIDWYWQTWINGELVYEEYLYSSCGCSGGTGGGGGGGGNGGGNPTPEQHANAILDYMQNSTSATSQTISNESIEETPTTRVAMYKWKCVSGAGWQISSVEKGTHIKVNNRPPASQQWQWQSLEHINTTIEGTVLGGTVSHSLVYANPIIGLYNAVMNLEINVHMATTYANITYSRDFSLNPSKNFNVNGSPYLVSGY